MAQTWTFETPVNVTATDLVNLTWTPHTFNSAKYGNFTLNLWLLRHDDTGDTVVKQNLPFLLASNHSVFDYSVLWTPSLDDVDFNVPEAGNHQLAWEQYKNNTSLDPLNTECEGWSTGFNIKAPLSSSSSSISSSTSTSSTPSSTSSSLVSTTTPPTSQGSANATPSTSGPSSSTIIGLVVGLVLLLLIFVGAAFWGVRKYRRVQRKTFDSNVTPPGYPLVSTSKVPYSSLPDSWPNSTSTTAHNSIQSSMRNTMPVAMGEVNGHETKVIKPYELSATPEVAEL